MKAFALLLTCLAVIIIIRQPPQMIICPQPPSLFVKAEDGSYIQNGTTMTTLQSCWGKATSWQEEWTDYPEKGGKFIRRVEPK